MKVVKISFLLLVGLLGQDAMLNAAAKRPRDGDSPVQAQGGHRSVFVAVVEEDSEEASPLAVLLYDAIVEGNIVAVRELVDQGADIEERVGAFDCPALHTAVSYGHIAIARYLIEERGANIEALGGNDDYTPLHLAVYHCQLKMARLLVLRGADVDAVDGEGRDLMGRLEEAIDCGIYDDPDADADAMRAWLDEVLPVEQEESEPSGEELTESE